MVHRHWWQMLHEIYFKRQAGSKRVTATTVGKRRIEDGREGVGWGRRGGTRRTRRMGGGRRRGRRWERKTSPGNGKTPWQVSALWKRWGRQCNHEETPLLMILWRVASPRNFLMYLQIIMEFQTTSKAKKMQMEVRSKMPWTEIDVPTKSAPQQIFSQRISHSQIWYPNPALVHRWMRRKLNCGL